MIWMGVIGFIDDYIKIFKKNKQGLRSYYKLIGQGLIGVFVGELVGLCVGEVEGLIVGLCVGELDGLIVGLCVGELEGLIVGV